MNEPFKTFKITIGQNAYDRLKYVADKIPTSPASMFLYLGLQCLRDVTDGVHHIDWYRKRLLTMRKEIKNEQMV